MTASVHELQARGQIPNNIPVKGAIAMMGLGSSSTPPPALADVGRSYTEPNKGTNLLAPSVVPAESATPSLAQKSRGPSPFAEHADPVQALVVDDDP
jgi:hypothetical protein